MPTKQDKLKNNPKWYDSENWFSFIFKGLGYQFPGMIFSVITMSFATAILAFLQDQYQFMPFDFPPFFHTVLGIVIGLLLVFRTNTAYDRWWEGRKQVGILVNFSRNIAIKYQAYLHDSNYSGKAEIAQLLYGFAWAMKNHLRAHDYSEINQYVPKHFHKAFLAAEHKPNFMLLQLSIHTQRLLHKGYINGQQMLVLEQSFNKLTEALGACERIRNTPIPMGYAIHLKRILLIYVISLPISFIHELEYWAVPVAAIVFYTMVGIELVGEEIEDPFGTDPNDLPIDTLTEKIRTNVMELMDVVEAQEFVEH
ncbi:MAG: bestrophin family protein [Flammeovirgaceae bacterium]